MYNVFATLFAYTVLFFCAPVTRRQRAGVVHTTSATPYAIVCHSERFQAITIIFKTPGRPLGRDSAPYDPGCV